MVSTLHWFYTGTDSCSSLEHESNVHKPPTTHLKANSQWNDAEHQKLHFVHCINTISVECDTDLKDQRPEACDFHSYHVAYSSHAKAMDFYQAGSARQEGSLSSLV